MKLLIFVSLMTGCFSVRKEESNVIDKGAVQGQCSMQNWEKEDCGFFGVDEGGCKSKGCCWAESNSGAPWCFHIAQTDTGGEQCTMANNEKQDCGWMGIKKQDCESEGCCWAKSNSGAPWCFKSRNSLPKPPPKIDIDESPAMSPRGHSMAFVHLFEWKWDDIAEECEQFLGPKGYTAVQVSPPNEHIQGDAWWTRYQPVSYKLLSRSGDEAAFASMVKRCKAVGVGIYFDAVINHMASGRRSGTGFGGSQYSNRKFPEYSPQDFHHDAGDMYSNCGVKDYNDKWNVQYCDLVGLADLCTGCPYVQDTIAAYINRLVQLGVAGFRIDAAKHIDAGDLRGILSRVDDRVFRFLEVIGHAHEGVYPSMYYHLGSITEFNWNIKLSKNLKNPGKLKYFENFGEAWHLMPHQNAVIFVDNHDTQRGHAGEAALTHKSGPIYTFANIFMLAHPYGYPKVMSSYNFQNSDQGPPSQSVRNGTNCGHDKDYTCEHRWPAIANMVGWRKSAGENWITSWISHGADQVSFCRGGAACIVMNRMEHSNWEATVNVEMGPGEYCNIIKSDDAACEIVRVGNDGKVHVKVEPMSAVAFHINARPHVGL